MTASLHTLDVRPILKAGGEPLAEIMKAAAALESGEGLRLLATFKPVPLFSIMQQRGYAHHERELGGGDWEIVFEPDAGAVAAAPAEPVAPSAPAASAASAHARPARSAASDWPAPSRSLDNRGMMPPEPMVNTLEALEGMAAGEVLEAWYDRDPLLLYPELEARSHEARCEKRGAGEFRVLIRRGAGTERAS